MAVQRDTNEPRKAHFAMVEAVLAVAHRCTPCCFGAFIAPDFDELED